jgi:hypothetical protein
MTSRGADSELFEEVVRGLLEQGLFVRFQARGASMSPAIRDGEIVTVTPVIVGKLRKDDVVLAKSNYGFRLHRIVLADHARDVFITRGDCGQENDPALTGAQILGVARAKEVRVGRKVVRANLKGLGGELVRSVARVQAVLEEFIGVKNRAWRSESSSATRTRVRNFVWVLGFFSLLLAASHARAQVAVADPTTYILFGDPAMRIKTSATAAPAPERTWTNAVPWPSLCWGRHSPQGLGQSSHDLFESREIQ